MSRVPAEPGAAEAALARAAEAGPYFALLIWPPGAPPPAGPWRPLAELVSGPGVAAERAGHARRVLAQRAGAGIAAVAERVAASAVFLGLASQLVSPLLGAAVLGGVVPELSVADLWWQPADSGPWPLAARPAGGTAVGELAAAGQLRDAAAVLADGIRRLTAPLEAAFGDQFRLSPRVLRGNVASAVAGAGAVLASAFPQRAGAAGQLAGEVLALGPLRGAGRFVPDGPGRRFVRRSCCLYYRVPGAGLCGDCVLTRTPPR